MTEQGISFGRYQILRRIATGGMAEVFLARVKSVEGFQREVVIKRILPEFSKNQDFVVGFLNEAKLTAHLAHPHIAQVFDLGQMGDSYFIAMEYIKGFDLSIMLAERRASKSRLELSVALRVMADLCEGLAYAHNATDIDGGKLNIVHRDITPSNVLVSLDGIGKIVDFGIAKATAASDERRTATGTVKGKLAYMAPEQVLGAQLDHRVDIFAAGIVLYEMLTSKNPFRGDNDFTTLKALMENDPPPPSIAGALQDLDPIVMRAIAKDPDRRYQHVSELLHELEHLAARLAIPLSHRDVAVYLQAHQPALERCADKLQGGGGALTGTDLAQSERSDTSSR